MPQPQRLRLATAAAATVLLLASCAASSPAGTAPADVPSSAVSATPAPAVQPVSLAPGEAPPLAFGGDCNAVVTEAEIDRLAGADLSRMPDESSGGASPIEVLGGIICAWNGGDYAFSVAITVIPAAGHEDRIAAEFSYPGGFECWGQDADGVGGSCYFGRIAAGYWLGGLLTDESEAGLRPTESIDALAALVEERATEHPAIPVSLPTGTWQPIDCATVAAGVADEMSIDPPAAGSAMTSAGYLGPGPVGAVAIVGAARCVWSAPPGFTTELTPGAGWALARLTEATPIEVVGATAAVLQEQADGTARIFATDGVNFAWITVPESSAPADAAAFLAIVMRAAG